MALKHHRVTVSLAPGHDSKAVLKKLKAAGFKQQTFLRAVGAATGTVATDKLDSVRKIAGVNAVEIDRDTRIAPPDSDVQ